MADHELSHKQALCRLLQDPYYKGSSLTGDFARGLSMAIA